MSETIQILEFVQVTKARQIDEEAGVLYDLVCLGPSSANNRDYPETTMREALHLFEGRQSFANHSKGTEEPSVYDLLGVWRDCRVHEGKVRGNFHYFKSHRLAPTLVEAARRPELNAALGFSINASGRGSMHGGRHVIESFQNLASIDCVTRPATCKSLFESRNPTVKSTVKALIESLKKTRPEYSRCLKEMAEAGVMSPDAAMDAPPDAPAAPTDHKQALKDAAKAIIDDDALDMKGMYKKLKAVLKMIHDEDPGMDDDAPDTDGDAETPESKRRKEVNNLREENARLKSRELLRVTADAQGVKIGVALLESVRPNVTLAEVQALVAELKGGTTGGGSQRPRSAAPLPPAGAKPANGQGNAPLQESRLPENPTAKDLGRFVNGR